MKTKLQSFVQADEKKCIGCRACELACSAVHSGKKGNTVGSIKAQVTPRLFLIKTPTVTMPVQCRHCEDAPCLKSCAIAAIRVVDKKVIVDEKNCTGCKNCILACPFGAVEMTQRKELIFAGKCDLCEEREAGPACVEVCPQKALRYIDPLQELQKKRKLAALAIDSLSLGNFK